jgi:hypothetical protein
MLEAFLASTPRGSWGSICGQPPIPDATVEATEQSSTKTSDTAAPKVHGPDVQAILAAPLANKPPPFKVPSAASSHPSAKVSVNSIEQERVGAAPHTGFERATDSPPGGSGADEPPTANKSAQEPADSTLHFVNVICCKLAAEPQLAPDERWRLVGSALNKILEDESLALWRDIGSLCLTLYRAAPMDYAKWVRTMVEVGEVFVYSGLPHRVSRLMMIARPHLIDELNLRSTSEILLLDTALGIYRAYVGLTQEVNAAHIMPGDPPPQEIASKRARTAATAQRLLETYIKTMAYLTNRRQFARVVDVKISDDASPQPEHGAEPLSEPGE